MRISVLIWKPSSSASVQIIILLHFSASRLNGAISFFSLVLTLIQEGKVFIAESPLYEITSAKGEIFFAYNETEKAEIIEKLEGKKYTLQRSKGLGENEPDMMWQTTMSPETRRLIQVSPADEYETQRIFETLLGDDIAARKAFIAENGPKYMDLADI